MIFLDIKSFQIGISPINFFTSKIDIGGEEEEKGGGEEEKGDEDFLRKISL